MIRHSCDRHVIRSPPAAESGDFPRIDLELNQDDFHLTRTKFVGNHDDTLLVRSWCHAKSSSRRARGAPLRIEYELTESGFDPVGTKIRVREWYPEQ